MGEQKSKEVLTKTSKFHAAEMANNCQLGFVTSRYRLHDDRPEETRRDGETLRSHIDCQGIISTRATYY